MTEELDLDALLGVRFDPPPAKGRTPKAGAVVECGQTPPKAPMHREWNNFTSFTLGGYVAKVTRTHCAACDNLFDTLEGVFIEEIHASGARRLTALAKGGDWPAQEAHRKEVSDAEVDYCAHCIGDLGFSREVDSKGLPYTLTFGRTK